MHKPDEIYFDVFFRDVLTVPLGELDVSDKPIPDVGVDTSPEQYGTEHVNEFVIAVHLAFRL
jgi:hypothetical protein